MLIMILTYTRFTAPATPLESPELSQEIVNPTLSHDRAERSLSISEVNAVTSMIVIV